MTLKLSTLVTRLVSRLRSKGHVIPNRLLFCCLFAATSMPARAAEWKPDPSIPNPQQHQRLYEIARKCLDKNFDPDANLIGAPSKRPPNKKTHATRDSAYYAYTLLLTGDSADRGRAQAILRRVVMTQDTKSSGPTLGAFGWYAENPPEDLNSAVFVGIALADIIELDRRHPCLDADVRQQVEASGKMAVQAVLTRDVDASYTNIVLLSIGFTAAGEKLWAVPGAGAWAERKLDDVMKMAGDSEFAEYLSPTYYGVAVSGAYEAKRYAFSDAFAHKVNGLIDHLWQRIAADYHAPTYQLAGPYARAYGDNMLEYAAAVKYDLYLALDGAYPLPDTDTDHEWDKGGLALVATLPIEPRPEFKKAPEAWREFKVVGLPTTPVRTVRQYRDGNFVLGTVASQDEWKQKRHLVAYWRTDGATPEQFRVGFCIDESNESVPDGFPGVKLHFDSQQVKDAAIVAISASTVVPGPPGCSTLVFAHDAKVTSGAGEKPTRIEDGAMTTYLYPISAKSIEFKAQADTRSVRITRSWSTADVVGDLHALAYLVVFRQTGQPAPVVTELTLTGKGNQGTVSAKVDGTVLSVTFK
ncbi:MAG: hypothetical protein JWM57_2782 [Phycisphaerales bacterium]|nr:hypothetical protein [Phycisphaerales bacterium]